MQRNATVIFAATAALALALGLTANAQDSSSATTAATTSKPATLAQRRQRQQDRIANGINSGQLTAGETQRLERREANISRETRDMRQDNGGKLTAADRAKLNRQDNRLSRGIYGDKHNAAAAHYGNGRIGQRRENQQDRIAQGVKSGSLTAGETSRLEGQQRRINRRTRDMREDNGGHLNRAQRRAVNRQQNRASRHIYRAKHNGRRR